LLDFAFVTIMTNQYSACTRGDHESSYIRDWHARKSKYRVKLSWKIQNLMVPVVLVFLWLV